MEYQKRDCDIKFDVWFDDMEGAQSCTFSIDGEEHHFWLSYAMGSLFGSLLDATYGLCIELMDQGTKDINRKYGYDIPGEEHVISGISSSAYWDNKGTGLDWTLARKLYSDEDFVDISLKYFGGENKEFHYQVKFTDFCYGIANAVTKILKQSGICGYHFSAIDDSINMVRFLLIKHIGLTGKIEPFWKDDLRAIPFSSLEDELELIRFEM